jgi:hypothetical protein
MPMVTISKEEYARLRRRARAYQKLSSRLFEAIVRDPVEEIVVDFRNTDLYSDGFLKDLEDGLRKSSLAKR